MASKKKDKGANLPAKPAEQTQALSLEQVLAHPVVQEMSKKLEEMRELVAGLPEAVGRAVAAHQSAARAQPLSAAPIQVKGDNVGVEFHRKGKIVQGDKVVAQEGLMDRHPIPVSLPMLGPVPVKTRPLG